MAVRRRRARPRPHYHPNYYGGLRPRPDGNKIQAVCHRKPRTGAAMTDARHAAEAEIARYLAERDRLQAHHAYDPAHERDACGVGLVTSIDGVARREVVEAAIGALKAVASRRGRRRRQDRRRRAGIHVQVPREFLPTMYGAHRACCARAIWGSA